MYHSVKLPTVIRKRITVKSFANGMKGSLDEKLLDLSGNPKIIRDTDTFSAQEITLNMETEEITLDGKVRGSVVEKKTKEESENQEENK